MKVRNFLLSKNSVLFGFVTSFVLFQLLKINYFFRKLVVGKNIQIKKGASISIHFKTDIQLKKSKIILHEGATFKVGYNYGYFDGGGFSALQDVCRIHLQNATLHIYGDVSLYPGMTLISSKGIVTIKNNTAINGFSKIICKSEIEIGENCVIAQGVVIRDDDGHKHGKIGGELTNTPKPVKIGNNCWIGQNASILKGVILNDGCIVAAGAVVSKSVESNTIVAGVPAKKIAENSEWRI